ncbi:12650_t:CDS:2, partial [Funneliformis mosseae]
GGKRLSCSADFSQFLVDRLFTPIFLPVGQTLFRHKKYRSSSLDSTRVMFRKMSRDFEKYYLTLVNSKLVFETTSFGKTEKPQEDTRK